MDRLLRFCLLGLLALLACCGLSLAGCTERPAIAPPARLTIGLVSYGAEASAFEPYQRFQTYLAEQLQAVVELDPAYNELRAVEQVQQGAWSLVFAPAGLAAIARSEAQYLPIFPLEGTPNLKSVIVVRADSAATALSDIAGQIVALGQPGSATGYYLPLYDLYGLTLAEVRFAPTPKTTLEWLEAGTVAAGALSEDDFTQYRSAFAANTFRVLHQSRVIPPGAVLLSPAIERNQQQQIEAAMKVAPASLSTDAGYLPNAPVPEFDQLIQLVAKVRPIEANVRQKPAVLTIE